MSYQEFRPRQFQQIPIVVKNILIINIILFVLSRFIFDSYSLDNILDLHYFKSRLFKPHQFITYMFMHFDITHLFFNMFGVYMFGSILENIWGSKRFLNFYILCGLGAALAQFIVFYFQDLQIMAYVNQTAALLPDDAYDYKNEVYNSMVCLGASGALFGLLVAFAMMFPNTPLHLYFFIPIKAKYVAIGYGLIELIYGFKSQPGDNVAHFAHLGGALVGLIIVLIWNKNRKYFY